MLLLLVSGSVDFSTKNIPPPFILKAFFWFPNFQDWESGLEWSTEETFWDSKAWDRWGQGVGADFFHPTFQVPKMEVGILTFSKKAVWMAVRPRDMGIFHPLKNSRT